MSDTPAPARKPRDFKSAITSGRQAQPLRITIYGDEGIGKTGLCAGAEAPLLIGAETGSAHYDTNRIQPEDWLDFLDLLAWFATPAAAEYRTLCLDTYDAIEALAIDYVCKRDQGTPDSANKIIRNTWVDGKANFDGYPFQGGARVVEPEIRAMIAALDKIRVARGCHVIITAHKDVVKEKNAGGDDYGIIAPRSTRFARELLVAWSDAVLYAEFVRQQLLPGERNNKGQQTSKAKVIFENERVVHTVRNGAYIAKNRIGLKGDIPLAWAPIAAAGAETYGEVETQRARLLESIGVLLAQVSEDTRTKAAAAVEKAAGSVLRLIEIESLLRTRVRAQQATNGAASA